MSRKYLSPEEEEKIKEQYQSGQYTYSQLAKMYFVSKSTIINVVKGYPYTDKAEYWQRVYRETVTNMDEVMQEIKLEILECLKKHDSIKYQMLMRQQEHLLSFCNTEPKELYERLKQERNNVEQSAWKHLAEHNYTEFAYFQSLWHRLNKIIGDHRKNPWGDMPKKTGAKHRAVSVKYYSNKGFRQLLERSNNLIVQSKIISDELYDELKHCILSPKKGRPFYNPRHRLETILRLFITGDVPEQVCPKTFRSIYYCYNAWYKSGVFRLLWELSEKYSELEPVKPALLFIEQHRLLYPDTPPKFRDVQIKNRRP